METALAIIDKARSAGALIYCPQNIACPPLYKAEVTEIKARQDEFHNMKGKYMPNRAVTDRISEAVGVDFIASECSVVSETQPAMPEMGLPARTVFIGYAQGRVRLPDGSWRNSSKVDYEFDPILRAKLEGTGDKGALEYFKFARQRASTGARLGVIRQLAGMPVTFTAEEIKKPLVFSRIVQNTEYVLSTPEGKRMAIAMATGAAQMMYGKAIASPAEKEEESIPLTLKRAEEQQTGPASSGADDDWDDEAPAKDTPSVRIAQIIAALEEWAASETAAAPLARKVIDRKVYDLRVLEASLTIIKYIGEGATKGRQQSIDALAGPGATDPVILETIVGKIKGAAA